MQSFVLGLAIGLAAGASPGPLLALVVSQTLRSGRRAGLLTAAAPLVSDVIVVAGTLLLLGRLPHRTLALVGVAGGGYVLWTGWRTWSETAAAVPVDGGGAGTSGAALRRAVTVNLLSPHPWLSWATALGPLTLDAWRSSPGAGAALVSGFYLTLIGTKVGLALLVAGGRDRLGPAGLRRAVRAAAVLLVLAGAGLAVQFAPELVTG